MNDDYVLPEGDLTKLDDLSPAFRASVNMIWHQKEQFTADGSKDDVPDQVIWSDENGPLLIAFCRGREALLLATKLVTVPLGATIIITHQEAYSMMSDAADSKLVKRDPETGEFEVFHPVTGEPIKAKDIHALHEIGYPGVHETLTSTASFIDGHMEAVSRNFGWTDGNKLTWGETRVAIEDLDKGQKVGYGRVDGSLRLAFNDEMGLGGMLEDLNAEIGGDPVRNKMTVRCMLAKLLMAANAVTVCLVAADSQEESDVIAEQMTEERMVEFNNGPLGLVAHMIAHRYGLV